MKLRHDLSVLRQYIIQPSRLGRKNVKNMTAPRILFALQAIRDEVERAETLHAPIHSLHEGYAVILEELDEVKAEVWKKSSQRDMENIKKELVQCAAMCVRTLVNLELI